MDQHETRRLHALNTPHPGPGFLMPRGTDALIFGQMVPQSPEFWGALPGTFIISVSTHPTFVSMLRAAAAASKVALVPPQRGVPVRVGLHAEPSALAVGGPFSQPALAECGERWGLSVDDWARLLLHAVFHGKQSLSLALADCPPAVCRVLQCCSRRIQGLTDPVAGADVAWRILPSVPRCELTGVVRDRRALVYCFLATKRWVNDHAHRRHLRGVWEQVLSGLRAQRPVLVRKEGLVAQLPVANDIISSAAVFLDKVQDFAAELRARLRDLFVDESKDDLWTACARVAVTWDAVAQGRTEVRTVATRRVTDAEVLDEMLRSYQVCVLCLSLSSVTPCQFGQIPAIDAFPAGVWEACEGINRIDWLISPYRNKHCVAFESRVYARDTPTLWIGWESESMRRACRLAGWVALVAAGRVAAGTALPLAPLLARVLAAGDQDCAVLLFQRFGLLFDHREADAATVRDLLTGGWLPLLARPQPPRELGSLLLRVMATHSLRTRAVPALAALVPKAVGDELLRTEAKHRSSEFFALTGDLRTRLLCALCTAENQTEVVAWVRQHWRALSQCPSAPCFQVTHNVCWAEPVGSAPLADYLRRGVPAALVAASAAFAHRVEARTVPTFRNVAEHFGLAGSWEGPAAADGFVSPPAETTHAFLQHAIEHADLREALAAKVAQHWRAHEPHATDPAPWAEPPCDFLAPYSVAAWWGAAAGAGLFAALTELECEARGARCRWAGLTPLHAMHARSFPLAREGGTLVWPDEHLPLLVDANGEPAAGPLLREVLRTRFAVDGIQLNPVSPTELGHGRMDIEAALAQ